MLPLSCTKPTDCDKKNIDYVQMIRKFLFHVLTSSFMSSFMSSCKCFFTYLTEPQCSFFHICVPCPLHPLHTHIHTLTLRVLAPVAKQLSEMWRCGVPMLHHCHLPITCIPSPPSPSPLYPSIHQHFQTQGSDKGTSVPWPYITFIGGWWRRYGKGGGTWCYPKLLHKLGQSQVSVCPFLIFLCV